jgi:DNA polymerase III subunit delta'
VKPLPWQHDHWRRFCAAHADGRLAHALLLSGPAGVGKAHFAVAASAYLLCTQREADGACGTCTSCVQAVAGSHPDLLRLAPEEGKRGIAVDSVRALIERLSVYSHRGGARTVIVDPAETFSPGAANAMLKTLEEPPAGTHFLLITSRPRTLPATVRSRAQILRFPLPPREQAAAWLAQAQPDMDPARLEDSGGAPLLALALDREGVADQYAQWRSVLDAVAQRRQGPLEAAAAVGKDKAADRFLGFLQSHALADLRRSMHDAACAERLDRFLQWLLQARRQLAANASTALTLESAMILWSRLNDADGETAKRA